MRSGGTTLAAIVLATRGGARLDAALARLAWADARIVLDPAGAVAEASLPAGVSRLEDASRIDAAPAGWLVLLGEDETLEAEGVARLRLALDRADGRTTFRLPVAARLFEVELEGRRPSVRVAARGVPLGLRGGLSVEFAPSGPSGDVDARIVRCEGTSLTDAVEALSAEAGALAALVDRVGWSGRGIVWRPLVAGARILVARARSGRAGLGRWVVATIEAYRVVVAYAKLWERRRNRVLELA